MSDKALAGMEAAAALSGTERIYADQGADVYVTPDQIAEFIAAALPGAKYTRNTATGAQVAAAGDLTGAAYVSAEYSDVGANNLTTRTAALMFADIAHCRVGFSYVLELINTSGGTMTLLAGTGVTLLGTMTVAANATRRFNVKFTSLTACTIQSIGTGTIS